MGVYSWWAATGLPIVHLSVTKVLVDGWYHDETVFYIIRYKDTSKISASRSGGKDRLVHHNTIYCHNVDFDQASSTRERATCWHLCSGQHTVSAYYRCALCKEQHCQDRLAVVSTTGWNPWRPRTISTFTWSAQWRWPIAEHYKVSLHGGSQVIRLGTFLCNLDDQKHPKDKRGCAGYLPAPWYHSTSWIHDQHEHSFLPLLWSLFRVCHDSLLIVCQLQCDVGFSFYFTAR